MAAQVGLSGVVALRARGQVGAGQPVGEALDASWANENGVVTEEPIEVQDVVEASVTRRQVVVERDAQSVLHLEPERRAERLEVLLHELPAEPRELLGRDRHEPVIPGSPPFATAVGNSDDGSISSTGSPRSRSIASSTARNASSTSAGGGGPTSG